MVCLSTVRFEPPHLPGRGHPCYAVADYDQICFIDQGDVAFYYLSIASRGGDGTIWTTWNYPFSHSLKLVPQLKINRVRTDESFLQLYESHRSFLQKNGVAIDGFTGLQRHAARYSSLEALHIRTSRRCAATVTLSHWLARPPDSLTFRPAPARPARGRST